MHRFAHISDIHLGAYREPEIRELEKQVLEETVKKCIELRVDFVLVCGDIYHVGIPDLSVVNDSILILRKLQLAGIPLYAIYGSHDYTPNGTSIIDILDTAGILTNVMKSRKDDEGYVILEFTTDPKSGAKIAGISARRVGLESKTYEDLDRKRLESEKGFKIFAFHGGIAELKPTFLSETEAVPISEFPKGFDYYAGGHIHQKDEFTLPGYSKIVFPGPLFTGYGRDIEDTAKGVARGFYVVAFEEKITTVEFVPVKGFDGEFQEFNATGKNSHELMKDLSQRLDRLDVNGKVVIIRVKGELSGGRTNDIDFQLLRRNLLTRGALFVLFNRFSLSTKEFEGNRVSGEDPQTIETSLFKENIGSVKVTQSNLKGDEGAASAIELLKILKQQQKSGETKLGYADRIVKSSVESLNITEEFSQ